MKYIFKRNVLRDGNLDRMGSSGNLPRKAAKEVAERTGVPEHLKRTVTKQARKDREALKNATQEHLESATLTSIPEVFLKNTEVVKQLQAMGILENDRSVTENTKVIEKYRRYIEILNFVADVERDSDQKIQEKKDMVDNYLFLTNTASAFIGRGKEMIQMMYIDAIYRDIINEGAVLTSTGVAGGYEIIGNGKGNVEEYERVIDSHNVRNIIDVAILSSMVGTDFILNQKELIGQKSLIEYILVKYAIKGGNDEPIQARLLGLQKKHVLSEIVKLKEKSTSTQAIQELTFLENYLGAKGEEGNYERKEYNRELFKNLNLYKAFQNQRALIQAMPELQNTENMGDQDYIDVLTNVAKENQAMSIGIALFAWLLGYKKVALGSALFGALGPSLGKAAKDIQGHGKNVEISDNDLELVEQQDIKFTLEIQDYQAGYERLADLNNANRKQQVDENNRELPYMDNKELFEIVDFITGTGVDINVKSRSARGDLESALPRATHTRGIYNVKTFLALLKSPNFEKDDEDKTTLDYLTVDGIDINNKHYEGVTFISQNDFNKEMNDIFKRRFDYVDSEKKEEVLKLGEKIKGILGLLTGVEVSNPKGDSFDTKVVTVMSALEKYDEDNSGLAKLANKLEPIFENYKKYQELAKQVDIYDGVLDSNKDIVRAKISELTGNGDEAAQYADLTDKINTLEGLLVTDTILLSKYKGFVNLNDTIKGVIEKMKTVREEISNRPNLLNIMPGQIDITSMFNDPRRVTEVLDNVTGQLEGYTGTLSKMESLTLDQVQDVKGILTMDSGAYSILIEYLGQKANLSIDRTHANQPLVDTQDKIIAKLNEFEGKKDKLKQETEKVLTDYFAKNNAQKIKAEAVDVNDSTKIQASLTSLQKVKTYLDNEQFNLSVDVWNIVLDLQYGRDLGEVDKDAKDSYDKAKEVFGTITVPHYDVSFQAIQSVYESKRAVLEATVTTFVQGLDVNVIAPDKIKENAQILLQIETAYKEEANNANLINTIDTKITNLKDRYLEEVTIKKDVNILRLLGESSRDLDPRVQGALILKTLFDDLKGNASTMKIIEIQREFEELLDTHPYLNTRNTANDNARKRNIIGLFNESKVIEYISDERKIWK